MCAINAQGNSKWSDVISHSTMSVAPGESFDMLINTIVQKKRQTQVSIDQAIALYTCIPFILHLKKHF